MQIYEGNAYFNVRHWLLLYLPSQFANFENCHMKYVYKLSVSQLCTSLKHRSKEYFRESNLHGIPYIVDSTRPKWERYFYMSNYNINQICF